MELSVQDLAKQLNGKAIGNETTIIKGAAGLSDATSSDVTFLKDLKNAATLNNVSKTKAGAVIVPEGMKQNGVTLIEVKNPMAAFSRVLEILAREKQKNAAGVHPMAYVSKKATLGKNVTIGPFCIIEDDAVIEDNVVLDGQCYVGTRSKIGQGTKLYPQVTIREDNVIGKDCIIHAGTVIGTDGYGFYFENGKHNKIPQIGNVIVEDNVEIGSCTTIDRATTGSTRIKSGAKIDNLVQIAHNVEVGEHSLLVAQVGIAGSSTLEPGVVLAGQVGVADHVRIGKGAQVGAQSGLKDDVKPGSVLFGSPAQPIQDTIKQMLLIRKLPSLFKDFKKIKEKFEKNG